MTKYAKSLRMEIDDLSKAIPAHERRAANAQDVTPEAIAELNERITRMKERRKTLLAKMNHYQKKGHIARPNTEEA